jgi:hypothetical protein
VLGEVLIRDQVIRAEGYLFKSGWYLNREFSDHCATAITGKKLLK